MNVVFSVDKDGHVSEGEPDLISYSRVHCNLGDGWVPPCTFKAPVSGTYIFWINFVKDSYYHDGTKDDVKVWLYHNGGRVGAAWSGQGAGDRGSGSYTVALTLEAGDKIETFAAADRGERLHVAECNFTGMLAAVTE